MTKHYNPFKMWGSWIGAGIGLIIMGWWLNNKGYTISLLYGCTSDGCSFIATLVYGLVPLILGFLLGWGIHSLFRRMK